MAPFAVRVREAAELAVFLLRPDFATRGEAGRLDVLRSSGLFHLAGNSLGEAGRYFEQSCASTFVTPQAIDSAPRAPTALQPVDLTADLVKCRG